MNINQKQNILNVIEQIKQLDLDSLFIAAYPNAIDLRSVNVKKYSALDLKSLIKKCINSICNELSSPLGMILPNEQNFNNEYGNINLESSFASVHAYLVNGQLEFIEREIDKLIFYQISLGFWEKSRIKQHPIKETELNNMINSVQLGKKSLDKLINSVAILENQHAKSISDLQFLIQEKTKEFEIIAQTQIQASRDTEKINNFLEKVKDSHDEVAKIQANQRELLKNMSVLIQDYTLEFKELSDGEARQVDSLKSHISKAEEQLNSTKIALDYMSSKEDEIKKLTGYAADGALGSKFDERRSLLQNSLKYWMIGVVVSGIASLIWVAIVFTYLKSDMGDKWLTLIVNLAKTSPAFFLLGFMISHYNRERSIQEEYAFKSAVAMTLTAYSEMLEDADAIENDSRQKMLCRAIDQLYLQPKIHPDNNTKVYAFSTKELTDSVKNLTDLVKDIKS